MKVINSWIIDDKLLVQLENNTYYFQEGTYFEQVDNDEALIYIAYAQKQN